MKKIAYSVLFSMLALAAEGMNQLTQNNNSGNNNTSLTTITKGMYPSNITEVTIPASVKEIEDEAFRNCKQLTKVDFGANSKLEKMKVSLLRCFRFTIGLLVFLKF